MSKNSPLHNELKNGHLIKILTCQRGVNTLEGKSPSNGE